MQRLMDNERPLELGRLPGNKYHAQVMDSNACLLNTVLIAINTYMRNVSENEQEKDNENETSAPLGV